MSPQSTVIIPVRHIRQELARKIQALQHGIIGLILLMTGLESFGGEETVSRVLTVLDILGGTMMIATIAKEYIRKPGHRHASVHWPEIGAGLLLAIEGIHKAAEGSRHFPIAICYAFAGALTFYVGVRGHRFIGLRRMTLSGKGFYIRTRPFVACSCGWNEMSNITVDERGITILLKNGGRKTIDVTKLTNREDILKGLRDYLDRFTPLTTAGRELT